MGRAEDYIEEALAAYELGAPVVGAVRFGEGHINDTFCVHTQPGEDPCRRFILQRISSAAFHHPDQVMENIAGVTAFLGKAIAAAGGDPSRETMTVVPTRDGKSFYSDSEGGAWRVYPFIEGTVCLQAAETPELFAASARTFGRFQRMLKDYPADTLYETIPHFHDTADRYKNFEKAVAENASGRAADVEPEIAFVRAREADTHRLVDLLAAGELPLRVTHNDTKLNNVMLDDVTGRPVAVIDLDTVMPGLSLYDFGDSIRFGANPAAEDEQDLSKVYCDLNLFEEYTKGFLEECGDMLTAREIELLPFAAKIMTFECGIRFLTDHIAGDTYFKIHREGHNLDRCRTQFKLVADMEAKMEQMKAIVAKYAPAGK